MYRVNHSCHFCDQGLIGFFRCDDGQTLVLFCDECDMLWLDVAGLIAGDWVDCHHIEHTFMHGDRMLKLAGCATREEIEAAGLAQHIHGYYED